MHMSSLKDIKEFLDQKNIVVAGVSRSGKNIGNSIYNELKKKNYNVVQLNPNADEIMGEKCFKSFEELPKDISAAVLCVQPSESISAVKEALNKGIKKVWMQLGSDSEEAINFCKENNMVCVYGQCFLMFAEPVESVHKFHRFFYKLFGKYPK